MNMRYPRDSEKERKPINYKTDVVREIDSIACTAWEVITPTERFLVLFSKDAQIEHVHNFVKAHHLRTKFYLSRVDVGQFEVSHVVDSYKGDGRWVDQDWNVVLDPLKSQEPSVVKKNLDIPSRVPPIVSRNEPPDPPVKSCGCSGLYHIKNCALNNDT